MIGVRIPGIETRFASTFAKKTHDDDAIDASYDDSDVVDGDDSVPSAGSAADDSVPSAGSAADDSVPSAGSAADVAIDPTWDDDVDVTRDDDDLVTDDELVDRNE